MRDRDAGADLRLHAGRGRAGRPEPHRCEKRVLLYSAIGLSTPETAEVLSRSPETVKSHRDSLLRKLGARNIAHAIALSYDTGILKPGVVGAMEERLLARTLAERVRAA